MEWVFDASIVLAWCFDDERTPQSDALFDKLASKVPAVVPQIWPLEISNVLLLASRKRRISETECRQFLGILENAAISVDVLSIADIFSDVIHLADKHRLTCYDAAYLELCMRLSLPLATLDKDLRKAAASAGVRLL